MNQKFRLFFILIFFFLLIMVGKYVLISESISLFFLILALILPIILICLALFKPKYFGFNLERGSNEKVDVLIFLFLINVITLIPSFKIGFINLEYYWSLAVIFGIIYALIAFKCFFKSFSTFSKWANSLGVLLLGMIHAYGLIIIVNCHFEVEVVEKINVQVVGKKHTHGRKGPGRGGGLADTYEVIVSENKKLEKQNFYVFKNEYDQISENQMVNVVVNKGLLGLTWYQLRL